MIYSLNKTKKLLRILRLRLKNLNKVLRKKLRTFREVYLQKLGEEADFDPLKTKAWKQVVRQRRRFDRSLHLLQTLSNPTETRNDYNYFYNATEEDVEYASTLDEGVIYDPDTDLGHLQAGDIVIEENLEPCYYDKEGNYGQVPATICEPPRPPRRPPVLKQPVPPDFREVRPLFGINFNPLEAGWEQAIAESDMTEEEYFESIGLSFKQLPGDGTVRELYGHYKNRELYIINSDTWNYYGGCTPFESVKSEPNSDYESLGAMELADFHMPVRKALSSEVWRGFEALMTFVVRCKRSTSIPDLMLNVGEYIRNVTGKTLGEIAYDFSPVVQETFEDLWRLSNLGTAMQEPLPRPTDTFASEIARDCFTEATTTALPTPTNTFGELQSDEQQNPFTWFRMLLSQPEKYWNHPLLSKVRSMFYHIVSFGLLDKLGITFDKMWFTKAEAEAIKIQHSSRYGFVFSILDGVSYICERLYDCYVTGTWNPLVHNGESYAKWADKVYQLKEDSQKLHNPEACGVNYHEYIERLRHTIEEGEYILRYSYNMEKSATLLVKRLMSEVRLLQAQELTKKAARQSREAPYAYLLYGGSSIGKTTLKQLLFYAFSKALKLPDGDEFMYTRSFADEYYSGFTSAVWFMMLDDIASKNPDLGEDLSMSEIIQIINGEAWTPPQADLADKGRTPMRPKIVMATTNTKHLHASAYYSNSLAIMRRFNHVITVSVKPEFAVNPHEREFMRMLDPSKMPPPEEGIPDAWDFKVEKVIPIKDGNSQGAGFKTVCLRKLNVYELISFLCQEAEKHFDIQEKVMRSKTVYRNLEMCPECFAPVTKCLCACQTCKKYFPHQRPDKRLRSPEQLCSCEQAVQSLDFVEISQSIFYLALTALVGYFAIFLHGVLSVIKQQDYNKIARDAASECVQSGAGILGNVIRGTKEKAATVVTDHIQEIRGKLDRCAITAKERFAYEREKVTELMREAGTNAQSKFVKHKFLLGLLITIPTIMGSWYIYRHFFQVDEVQSSWDTGTRIDVKDEKPNPWYRDEYQPDEFQIGRLTGSWKGLSRQEVLTKVTYNVLNCVVRRYEGDVAHCANTTILCVKGRLYVANLHAFKFMDKDRLELEVTHRPLDRGLGSSYKFMLYKDDCMFMEDRDLIFFSMASTPVRRDITGLFPTEKFKTVCEGAYVMRDKKGEVSQLNVRAIKHSTCPLLGGAIPSVIGIADRDTAKGDCGSPLIGFTPSGPVIMGIHLHGGSSNVVGSARIYAEDLTLAFSRFTDSDVQCSAPYLVDPQDKEISLVPLHHKSVFRYIEEGVCSVYGSIPGFRPRGKSKVTDTLIRHAAEKRGFPVKTGPPVMKGWQPYRKAAVDVVGQQFSVKQADVKACVDAFVADILAGLSQKDMKELVILDNVSTLNGIPGVKYIDAMNKNSSMGFPFNKKKKHYLSEPFEFEDWQHCVQFDDKIYERIDMIIEKYKLGERWMPIFVQHLKDEPRELRKILEFNTRVFGGAPADWSFVVRKYLLSMVRVIQNNRFLFEAAPGTNTTSHEWDDFFHYLVAFGDNRLIAGDYRKFDKKMAAVWILAAFDVIIAILRKAGWSESDILIIKCIAEDTAFPLCDMNGDLVEFWGSNPSGHPLTVIVNCLVNSLYLRFVWLKVGNDLSQFKEFVHLLTYGDDNVLSVAQSVFNFNHTVIAEVLATIGVEYTMADKTAESIPFQHISEVSFLQRTWRYDEEAGSCLAALNEDSIAKMLTKCIPSQVVCMEQHAVDILQNALREYFFHGRKKFEAKRELFLEIINECDLSLYFDGFATFDTFLAEYQENNREVWPDNVCPDCISMRSA